MGFMTKWEEAVELLSVEEKAFLDEHSRTVFFEAKEMLFKQRSFAVNCHIIKQGFCKLTYSNRNRKRIIRILHPGDILGKDYEHLEYYPYTVHTLTEVEATVVPMSALLTLCEKNKDVQILLDRYLRDTFTEVISWVMDLQFKNIEGSLAMFILAYCQEQYRQVFLTRAEISDFLGYSRESVIHTLKKFEKEGIIEILKKNIFILDEDGLNTIAKFG